MKGKRRFRNDLDELNKKFSVCSDPVKKGRRYAAIEPANKEVLLLAGSMKTQLAGVGGAGR